MPPSESKPGRNFTEAARKAPQAAEAARRDDPDSFGEPELFIVKASGLTFTWELRRFGGIVLQRGPEPFDSVAAARADGEAALAALLAIPGQPTFRQELRRKGAG